MYHRPDVPQRAQAARRLLRLSTATLASLRAPRAPSTLGFASLRAPRVPRATGSCVGSRPHDAELRVAPGSPWGAGSRGRSGRRPGPGARLRRPGCAGPRSGRAGRAASRFQKVSGLRSKNCASVSRASSSTMSPRKVSSRRKALMPRSRRVWSSAAEGLVEHGGQAPIGQRAPTGGRSGTAGTGCSR